MTGPWKASGTGCCRHSLCSSIPRDGLAPRMPSSCTTGFSNSSGSTCVPKRSEIKKVLVIGSGPIIIGQAAEFDYSGTQACRALSEEGVEVVLVNSNPATIMTDVEVAERVYVEPLTPEFVTAVIARERPDGLLATLGGQTGGRWLQSPPRAYWPVRSVRFSSSAASRDGKRLSTRSSATVRGRSSPSAIWRMSIRWVSIQATAS